MGNGWMPEAQKRKTTRLQRRERMDLGQRTATTIRFRGERMGWVWNVRLMGQGPGGTGGVWLQRTRFVNLSAWPPTFIIIITVPRPPLGCWTNPFQTLAPGELRGAGGEGRPDEWRGEGTSGRSLDARELNTGRSIPSSSSSSSKREREKERKRARQRAKDVDVYFRVSNDGTT